MPKIMNAPNKTFLLQYIMYYKKIFSVTKRNAFKNDESPSFYV